MISRLVEIKNHKSFISEKLTAAVRVTFFGSKS